MFDVDGRGDTRDGCLLGESIRRRPILPGCAPPRRPAVRRQEPTCPWFIRFLDSTLEIADIILYFLYRTKVLFFSRFLLAFFVLPNPKPGHTTCGSGRSCARQVGGAGQGQARRSEDRRNERTVDELWPEAVKIPLPFNTSSIERKLCFSSDPF